MEQIRSGGRRLTAMLDAILSYSRVDTLGQDMQLVALDEVVHQAWGRLEQAGQISGLGLQVDKLPTVWGDESQLVSVFLELFQNALRFRSVAFPALAVKACAHEQGLWRIEVCDNGIGIAAEQCEVVFEMFKTLHHRDAYPGLGAGLAVVRRIIERHGGEIHARPGETGGTVLWFTLHADSRSFARAAAAGSLR